jgi:hypothetical protein
MSATIHKLCCQGCGARLSVKEGTRLAVCEYCASQLEIVPGDTASHRDLEAKLEALKLREDLKDLDAAWQRYLAAVSTKDNKGVLHPPLPGAAFGYAVLGGIATLFAAVMLTQDTYWWMLVVVPVGIWITHFFWSAELKRFSVFNAARARYEARRAELVRSITTAS